MSDATSEVTEVIWEGDARAEVFGGRDWFEAAEEAEVMKREGMSERKAEPSEGSRRRYSWKRAVCQSDQCLKIGVKRE